MEPVWAVHVADGQLNSQVCLAGWLAACLLLGIAIRVTKPDDIPRIAVLSAVFFLASLLHVPTLIGARTHLLLTGLLGILLGWQSLIAIACGLSLQAILFSHGGVFSLGINLLVMGIPAIICGQVFRFWSQKKIGKAGRLTSTSLKSPAFATGLFSVLLVSSIYGFALLVGGSADWWPQIIATLIIHAPLAILEGIICAGVVDFQAKVAPETFFPGAHPKIIADSRGEPETHLNSPGEGDQPV